MNLIEDIARPVLSGSLRESSGLEGALGYMGPGGSSAIKQGLGVRMLIFLLTTERRMYEIGSLSHRFFHWGKEEGVYRKKGSKDKKEQPGKKVH